MLRGSRAVIVLDIIEQANNLAALNAVDRPRSERPEYVAPENRSSLMSRTQLLSFTGEVFVRNRTQRVLLSLPFRQGVAALSDLSLYLPGLPFCLPERQLAVNRHSSRPAVRVILDHVGSGAAGR